jgi:hypothetical protein
MAEGAARGVPHAGDVFQDEAPLTRRHTRKHDESVGWRFGAEVQREWFGLAGIVFVAIKGIDQAQFWSAFWNRRCDWLLTSSRAHGFN